MNKTNFVTAMLMALHINIICFANNTSETEHIYSTDIDGVQIDTRDGLSENKIRSLLIDRDDRLAVATSASVDIFDGTRFISIPAIPEEGEKLLTRTNTRRLREDPELGVIWLKTGILSTQKHSRLHAFDAATGTIVTEEALRKTGGPKRPWTDFFLDEGGNYWIIDSERNLHQKRDGKWRKTLNLDTFGKEEVWNISISPDGKCFHILYRSGKAYCIDCATLQVRATYTGREGYVMRGKVRWKDDDMYLALSSDNNDNALIIRHDPETTSFTQYAKIDRSLNDFIFDKDGALIAAPAKGMPETTTFATDRTGGLWIGTHDNGLRYVNPERHKRIETTAEAYGRKRSKEFCNSRAAEYATTYARDITNCSTEDPQSKTIFLATRKGIILIDSLRAIRARIDHRNGLGSDNVQAITAADSAVWFTTSSSVGRFIMDKNYGGKVVSFGRLDGIELNGLEFKPGELRVDSSGMIVAGFPGGSCRIDPSKITTTGIPVYEIHPEAESEKSGRQSIFFLIAMVAIVIAACTAAAIKLKFPSPKQRMEPENETEDKPESTERKEEHKAEIMRDFDISAMLSQPAETDPDEEFKEKLYEKVDANISDEEFNVQKLSDVMAMDRSNLYRKTQNLIGMSPSDFIKQRRLQVSKTLLADTDLSITDIAMKCGYSSVRYFSTVFKKESGMTPSEYRSEQIPHPVSDQSPEH